MGRWRLTETGAELVAYFFSVNEEGELTGG